MSNSNDLITKYSNCVIGDDLKKPWYPQFQKCLAQRQNPPEGENICKSNTKFLNCLNETKFLTGENGEPVLIQIIPPDERVFSCIKGINNDITNTTLIECRNLRSNCDSHSSKCKFNKENKEKK